MNCKKCNLPDKYPNISFGNDGICNYCHQANDLYHYKRFDVLKADIEKVLSQSDSNRKYDCAVGISGGRDSSYLLYYAKEVLKLNVLAICMDHDFITPLARQNIKKITTKLCVDLHYIKNEILNEESRKCVRQWAKKPDVAMCLAFCTGCRYGINRLIPQYAQKLGIPLLLTGHVPIEAKMTYRVALLCDNKKTNTINKLYGYGKRLLRNPSYLCSIESLYHQYQDFKSHSIYEWKQPPMVISPFYYVRWKEEEIIPKVLELGWEYDKEFKSSWRSDCYVGILRQYFYKIMLGFNDVDVYYAHLVRNDEMGHDDALKRIKQEGDFNEDIVRYILEKFYDLDLDSIKERIRR